MIYPVYDFIGVPLVAVFFLFLFFMETKFGLRKRKELRLRRIKRNGVIAATGLPFLRFALIPAEIFAARYAGILGFGIFNITDWPVWAEAVLAFLLLDYMNYIWHWLNHSWPLLWRFHNVHHIDLDLDVTTALRFHAGEVFLSVFFKAAFIFLIGASPFLVLIYEIFFEAANNFHHSNWRLPYKMEKFLSYFIVTPVMHGIHHSIIRRETDSNFSVIFSVWDRIHRTLRLNIPQDKINIGVPAYRDPGDQTIGKSLLMPFKEQRPWRLPDGKVPVRTRDATGDTG